MNDVTNNISNAANGSTDQSATSSPAVVPFWKSIDELAQTPEFLEQVKKEFPQRAGELTDLESRRNFLRLMAASMSFAGLSGCLRQPEEKIVPYVRQPEQFIPGKPLYYATCTMRSGYAIGTLVESHLGRPTKIEGNPEHPASLGAADAFAQASILGLYDPDRSQTVMKEGRIHTWGDFLTVLTAELSRLREVKGRGLAILTETVTSPTLTEQLQSLLKEFPSAGWYQYESVNRDNVRAGSKVAFGTDVDTIYHFDQADLVLSLDAEFLTDMPGSLRYARDFIDRRRVAKADADAKSPESINRLYAVESRPRLTGALADHRLGLKAVDVGNFAVELCKRLGIRFKTELSTSSLSLPEKWLESVISDLKSHRGRGLVISGDGQPPAVHALAHAINRHLGNVGTTVEYLTPVEPWPASQRESLLELIQRMRQGEIQTVVVLGGNPVYAAPDKMEFAKAFEQVAFRIHLCEEFNETSSSCHWHIPATHELEAWGDARAFDGTVTIRQPLIAPLYAGRSSYDILAAMLGRSELSTHQLVRDYWKRTWGESDFEKRWNRAVHDGRVADSRSTPINPDWKFEDNFDVAAISSSPSTGELELTIAPDPTIWDGRFANNSWLQELPKPLTKLTWENVAQISPRTALRLKVRNREIVELTVDGRSIRIPAWITPGQPDDSIGVTLGYGRTRSGRIGKGAGVDVGPIRPASGEWFAGGVQLRPTGTLATLAVTQQHHSMEGRDLIKVRTFDEFQQHPAAIEDEYHHPENLPTLYPPQESSEMAWGMSIDETACIGCNACVIACQSENNIPIVGKEQVAIGREMHWLRVDRYYRGDVSEPETYFQPVMCVHCENAPCELVCPVAATVHSHEGLNQMVYNRCVGTRYCSNNCPYKVRRFNFLDFNYELGYDGQKSPSLGLMRNPDVTVRSRGVMEKCTYCVQRINHARIEAEKAGRPIRDGDIQTACQQTCPTKAIVFGNISDAKSRVHQLKESPLDYSLLGELNTRPRTTYLARLQNPHPDLAALATEDTPSFEPTVIDHWLNEQRKEKASDQKS